MDALQKVLDTIMGVIEIIKNFFNELFPKKDDAQADPDAAPEA